MLGVSSFSFTLPFGAIKWSPIDFLGEALTGAPDDVGKEQGTVIGEAELDEEGVTFNP